MPSDAFIKAASAANRQPVVLLAIESIDAIKRVVTTQAEWETLPVLTNINTTLVPGEVRLATDGAEQVPGMYWYPVSLVSELYTPPTVAGVAETPVFHAEDRVTAITINSVTITTTFAEDIPYTRTLRLFGKLGVGDWQQLAEWDQYAPYPITCSLERGSWQFKLSVTDSAHAEDITSIAIQSYNVAHETHYRATGAITTDNLGMGLIPTVASRFQVDDVIPTGCAVAYSVDGRDSISDSWAALGTVSDGDTVAAHAYYRVSAALTGSGNGMETPTINELRIIGGDSQFTYISTHKDIPVHGALPYIAPGGVSAISSKIDLTQQATVGELTVKLHWRPEVGAMIAGGWLKNKTVSAKLGFLGLSEVDYEPYFAGTWYDYQSDQKAGIITVKTRNILKRFTRKIPAASYFLTEAGQQFVPPKTKLYSGNIMSVMLGLADELGIPDRLIDRPSFTTLAAGSRAGAAWDVERTVTEPQDAMEMLNELSVSSGVFLFEGADGRLTAKLYDDFAAATVAPVATLDAVHCKFGAVDGAQKDLFTRSAIYYNLLPGFTGGGSSDYADCLLTVNEAAEIAWFGEDSEEQLRQANCKEWKDKWGLSVTAIQLLAARWDSWFSVPRPLVKVDDVPPRYHSIERGQIVAVNNLQLVCPLDDWQGYSDNTRFLVMGKSISDPTSGNLTVSFDLMQLADAEFTTDPDFPNYSRLDYFPAAVTGFAASTANGEVFLNWADLPGYYQATFQIRVGGSDWDSATVLEPRLAANSYRYYPETGGTYTYRIKALNARGFETAAASSSVTVDISQRPGAGATRNKITSGSSAPSSPADGDIWKDTSTTPPTVKLRVSGAWVDAATYISTGSVTTALIAGQAVSTEISGIIGDITQLPNSVFGGVGFSIVGWAGAQYHEAYAIMQVDGFYYGESGVIEMRDGYTYGAGALMASMPFGPYTTGIFEMKAPPVAGSEGFHITTTGAALRRGFVKMGWRALKR